MRPYVAILMVIVMAMLVSLSESKCAFQAIFNFGDSNADTGNVPSMPSPNGMTYFNKPAGRACDGRLFIDFLGTSCFLYLLIKFNFLITIYAICAQDCHYLSSRKYKVSLFHLHTYR